MRCIEKRFIIKSKEQRRKKEMSLFKGKTLMITGGTGSFGNVETLRGQTP